MRELKDNLPINGFGKVNCIKSVNELQVSASTSYYGYDEADRIREVKRDLVEKLANSIIRNNLANFTEEFEPHRVGSKITAQIHVVDPGERYVNVIEDKFTVNGEVFSNEDLIIAVKETFPERFV